MRSIVALSFCVLVGCGGATQTDLFTDASAKDGGNGADGGGDAQLDAPAADCKTLLANVNDLRNNAVKCNGGQALVCDVQVEDLCCPLTVTGPASRKEVTDLVAAVKAAKAAGCGVGCPAVPCATKPTLKCNAGVCQQM